MDETKEPTPIADVTKKLAENLPKISTPRFSDEEIEEMQNRDRQQQIEMAYSSLIGNAGIPLRHARFKAMESQSVEWNDCLKNCSGLAAGYILGLIGLRGTGKTQMAVALIKRFCQKNYIPGEARGPLYVSAMDIFFAIRDAMHGGTSEKQAMDNFIYRPLLVIDECQERGETAFEDRTLTYIIDKRYGEMRSTILISNQTQAEFEKSVGSSVVSRMAETGGIKVFKWQSFRG